MKQKEPLIEPCVTLPPPPVTAVPPVTAAPAVASMSVGVKSTADMVTSPAKVKLSVLNEDKVERITGIRKAMVKAMTRAVQVPHFGYDDEVFSHVINVVEYFSSWSSNGGECRYLTCNSE